MDELSDELRGQVTGFFEKIPFNQVLGITLEYLGREQVRFGLRMDARWIGNYFLGTLHGGVIASILDVAGGAMAFIGTYLRLAGVEHGDRAARLAKLGTIDMRVDYLRPGKGEFFTAEAVLLRSGNKVSVTRMSLYNDTHNLIAVGTGTYLCG